MSVAGARPAPARGLGIGARLLLGIALLALAAGSLLVGSSLPQDAARRVGGNAPVNPGAIDDLDIRANNSPSIARSPTDPALIAIASRVDSPRYSCGLYVSRNRGASFTEVSIPLPEGEEPKCFAPDVAFGSDGTLYVLFATLVGPGNAPNAMWISTSSDGLRSLSTPVKVLGPLAFQARLLTDPVRTGRLILTWLQADDTALLAFPEAGYPIMSSHSQDGGRSWAPPVRVSPESRKRVVAPVPAARGNEVLVAYLDLGEDALDYHGGHGGRGGPPYPGRWQLVVARSADGGGTWSESVVDPRLVPIGRFVVFLPPAPSIAVDRSSGRVYAAFHDGRGGDPDVWIWSSADGRRWGAPVRVNDTPAKDGRWQYLPRLSVAPNGRLDVLYYDRRADPQNVMNEASLQYSTDQGRGFAPRIRLSDDPFDSRIGFGVENDLADLGSRLALLSTDRSTLAVWTDTRGGNKISKKQDLARAVVAFAEGSPLRAPLRIASLPLGLAGVALVIWVLLARLRSSSRLQDLPEPEEGTNDGSREELGGA
jgi:hypothetical protein